MSKEMEDAIREFIKDRLTVSIAVDPNWDAFSRGSMRAEVTLMLDGDVISSDSASFSVEDN